MTRFVNRISVTATVLALLATSAHGGSPRTTPDLAKASQQVMIRFKTAPGMNDPCAEVLFSSLAKRTGWTLRLIRPMSGGACVASPLNALPAGGMDALLKSVKSDSRVDFIEVNGFAKLKSSSLKPPRYPVNDPLFSSGVQWYLDDPLAGINAPAAWRITTGSPDIVIGIADSGVLFRHPELTGRLLPGYDMVSLLDAAYLATPETTPLCDWWRSKGGRNDCRDILTGDGDGRDADASDPGDWASSPMPEVSNSSWHGTSVAGVVGASTNNGTGLAGINWQSRLLPIRVAGRGHGFDSDIIDGLRWAAGLPVPGVPTNPTPASVINLSIGNEGRCPAALQQAIDEALYHSPLKAVVTAAGNESVDASGSWPGNCKGVINVAAIQRNGKLAPYSNHGAVTLGAPGGMNQAASAGQESTIPGLDNCGEETEIRDARQCKDQIAEGNPYTYTYQEGTSLSAPMVTGTISLMLSANRSLTPGGIKHILESTATPYRPGSDCLTVYRCGAGLLNTGRAVEVAARLPGGTLYNAARMKQPKPLSTLGARHAMSRLLKIRQQTTPAWRSILSTPAYPVAKRR